MKPQHMQQIIAEQIGANRQPKRPKNILIILHFLGKD